MDEPVNQVTHPALTLIAEHPDLFQRQGAVVATWRREGERKRGPYYQLAYRENGRQHWVYLGVAGPLVDAVREALDRLQRVLRQHRVLKRFERQTLASLRVCKAQLNAQLRAVGLHLKGFEVRGWRTSEFGRMLNQVFKQSRQPPAPSAPPETPPPLPPSPPAAMFRLVGLQLPELPRLPTPPLAGPVCPPDDQPRGSRPPLPDAQAPPTVAVRGENHVRKGRRTKRLSPPHRSRGHCRRILR